MTTSSLLITQREALILQHPGVAALDGPAPLKQALIRLAGRAACEPAGRPLSPAGRSQPSVPGNVAGSSRRCQKGIRWIMDLPSLASTSTWTRGRRGLGGDHGPEAPATATIDRTTRKGPQRCSWTAGSLSVIQNAGQAGGGTLEDVGAPMV